MWQQILDLPVIIQGALGSFLFWALYETFKKFINTSLELAGKISKHLKRELRSHEALHHAHCFNEPESNAYQSAHMLSIYAALNRFMQAMIYICLGLIFSDIFGELSKVAYLIASVYLFIALKAVRLDWGTEIDKEMHRKEYERLIKILNDNEEKA